LEEKALSASALLSSRRRFGSLELDATSGELYNHGNKVSLPPKSLQVLKALLERPGEVVTRSQLRSRLWTADTFVEFDDSLNHAVKKLRQALGDSAEDPQFIETLPRYGYRLVASVIPSAEAGPRIRSLAVLPMANLSGDPQQEYFADGITDAIIAGVSQIRAAKVISRTSVMLYKNSTKPLPQIGRELGVDGVIEGSVQRSDERVRITVQLIHALTDTHLWAESYEHKLCDVLSWQGEVARAVAHAIKAALTPDESARLASSRPISPKAYEAYLKGMFHWYKLSAGQLDRALSYFRLALEQDPTSALAHAGIANVWIMRADAGFVRPGEAFPKARAAVLTSLELDETLAQAHVSLANIMALYDWDWSSAERQFQRAIELNPSSADAHFMYGDFLASMKRWEDWAVESRQVLELDPLNQFYQCFYGWQLVYLRQYDDALAQLREALSVDPGFASVHMGLWGAYHGKAMLDEALVEAEQFFAILGDRETVDALRRGQTRGGYREAMRLAAEMLAERSKRLHLPNVRIARLYAHAGCNHQAIDWLQRAFEQRESPLMHLAVAWDWASLHRVPRFQDLLHRLGLPE